MISTTDRTTAIELIKRAVEAGARPGKACETVGISLRTYRRWTADGSIRSDGRPHAKRPPPSNKLSDDERQHILEICHAPEHASLPPSQIVPRLADQGRYIASESSFYRVLRDAGEARRRGRARHPQRRSKPRHKATAPNRVWSWDITWLGGPVRGQFFYLYMIEDIYSRKIVGWEVHDREACSLAAPLVQQTVLAEQCIGRPLVLHADNGSPQKGATLKTTFERLGITPSYSRPRVSDDNPFSESLFRTVKYRPDYPTGGFADITAARQWVAGFVRWYNCEHQHSAIKFVTPQQRHSGQEKTILEQRKTVYELARQKRPDRWARKTRNWTPIGAVWLNDPALDEARNQQQEAA